MNYRRHKTSPQQLTIVLSVMTLIGIYLFTSSDTTRGILTVFTTTTLSPEERLKIIRWKRNQTLSSWENSILSNSGRIYFHETSGQNNVNLRQLCAVESAAKENPDRSVQLFFQTDYEPHISLKKFSLNLTLKRIDKSHYTYQSIIS